MFAKEMIHFPNVTDFEKYLSGIVKPEWTKTLVIHHKWKPVESDWNGITTMQGMKKYYEIDVKEDYVFKILDNNVNTVLFENTDIIKINTETISK
jgi:hypothetical protein